MKTAATKFEACKQITISITAWNIVRENYIELCYIENVWCFTLFKTLVKIYQGSFYKNVVGHFDSRKLGSNHKLLKSSGIM